MIKPYTINNDTITHDTEVDFANRIAPRQIFLTKGEASLSVIRIKITNGGKLLKLTEHNYTDIRFRMHRYDGSTYETSILGYGGDGEYVYVAVTSELTSKHGPARGLLVIQLNETSLAGSSKFKLYID